MSIGRTTDPTGQRTTPTRSVTPQRGEDGQHYDRPTGAPGESRGMVSRIPPAANVGMSSGGELAAGMGATRASDDIRTETYEGGMSEEKLESPTTQHNEGPTDKGGY
jgi:hypothetical protein